MGHGIQDMRTAEVEELVMGWESNREEGIGRRRQIPGKSEKPTSTFDKNDEEVRHQC